MVLVFPVDVFVLVSRERINPAGWPGLLRRVETSGFGASLFAFASNRLGTCGIERLAGELPPGGIGQRELDDFIGKPSHRHLAMAGFVVKHTHQKPLDDWRVMAWSGHILSPL